MVEEIENKGRGSVRGKRERERERRRTMGSRGERAEEGQTKNIE